MNPMIRVLVADDHALVAETLAAQLDALGGIQVIGCVADGREAVNQALQHRPDVLIMDLSMPVLNGADATALIVRECPEIRIVCLSMHTDPVHIERMLKAGASGYVLKSAAFADLERAVRDVAAGRSFLSPEITSHVISGFLSPSPGGNTAEPELTLREREVLQLVSEGLSSKEIAEQVNLSVRTVENHRRRISDRLGLKSVAALTKYAIRHGLTDAGD